MNYLKNLWVKIRFNSPLRTITDILGRLSIRIAPYYVYIEELESLGRNYLYSTTLVFNTPALNFKKKLNAKFYKLRLFVDFFRKWKINVRLKIYCNA